MKKKDGKTAPKAKPAKLTMVNGAILTLPPQMLAEAIGSFLSQPFPILARVDLKMVGDAIMARARVLWDSHLALIKKHGGTEEPAGSDHWVIKPDHKNYPAFTAEYQELVAGKFSLPLPDKVKLPAKVYYQGKLVDLVMDGAAAALFGEIVEVQR